MLSSSVQAHKGVVAAQNLDEPALTGLPYTKCMLVLERCVQRGEQVWDPSKPRTSPNLVSDWQSRPLVVYDIAQDGTTGQCAATWLHLTIVGVLGNKLHHPCCVLIFAVYPPKYVVEVDGSRRPLNEQERVWQVGRVALQHS
jgi:hypothetical protein